MDKGRETASAEFRGRPIWAKMRTLTDHYYASTAIVATSPLGVLRSDILQCRLFRYHSVMCLDYILKSYYRESTLVYFADLCCPLIWT